MASTFKDDFKIEYAKSNRSTCKHCGTKIEKDSLRIGVMEPSDKFDGEYYVWHHVKCFFDKRPDVSDASLLKGFDTLRPSDQPKIKKFTDAASGSKPKAVAVASVVASEPSLAPKLSDDFKIEYAKSSRSKCVRCKTTIEQDSIRIGILEASTKFDGEYYTWHHVTCFFDKRPDVDTTSSLKGFDTLRPSDQPKIRKFTDKARAAKGGSADEEKSEAPEEKGDKADKEEKAEKKVVKKKAAKKEKIDPTSLKVTELRAELEQRGLDTKGTKPVLTKRLQKALEEEGGDEEAEEEEEEEEEGDSGEKSGGEASLLEQLWELKDLMLKRLTSTEMKEVLELNDQYSKGGNQDLAHRIADGVLKGAIPICPDCKKGALYYENGVYSCKHQATAWSSCQFTAVEGKIERLTWRHPKWWNKKMKPEPKKAAPPSKGVKRKAEPEEEKPKPKRVAKRTAKKRKVEKQVEEEEELEERGPVFEDVKILLLGDDLSKTHNDWKEIVKQNGGKVVKKISGDVRYVVASDKGVTDNKETILKAIEKQIPVVGEDFLVDSLAAKKLEDQSLYRLPLKQIERDDDSQKSGSKRKATSQGGGDEKKSKVEQEREQGKMRVVRKGRAAVDPYYPKPEKVHVLEEGQTIYNVMLNNTDITVGQRGRNSFYALQLLEHDSEPRWYIFRRWGRVGTEGSNKVEKFSKRSQALSQFEYLYVDKTGNEWSDRDKFEKRPGKFYPVEIDYGAEEKEIKFVDLSKATGSKLHPRVQSLVSLLFDIQMMKNTLVELEVDIKKMPLGKLTTKQIKGGYEVLAEIQNILDNDPTNAGGLLDCTNKFYTLIPQDFGTEKPPLIDNVELLKKKLDLLEALQDIEIATSFLRSDGSSDNAIDESYKKLKTEINPLDHDSEQFKVIKKYCEEGHDRKYFSNFTLEVLDVFTVNREGSEEHYKPWSQNANRQLLWHGSRLTNFVGILSQGLRIAPPEAPKSGYRFGKGIYFADIVSKSASYCHTSQTNPIGIMLLNEVALGNMKELYNDQYMEKPLPGYNSTKALGATAPDPKETVFWDGVQVPCGKPTHTGIRSSCSHNEYIIYDTAQCSIQYLLKIKFHHKY